MPASRRAPSAPLLTAAIAATVLVALVVVFFTVLLPYRRDHAAGGITSAENDAVTAGAIEAANALSYRRANFTADFNRALAGATGALKSDLQSQKSRTLQTITKGKYDLSAVVTNKALVGPTDKSAGGSGYITLVTLNGFQSTQKDLPTQSTLQVTVLRSGGKWLVSDIHSIQVS